MYAVTRQRQWPGGTHIVEIACEGLDYSGSDALAQKYPGEFSQHEDPRDAARVALDIWRAWKEDRPMDDPRLIAAYGCDLFLHTDSDFLTPQELAEWAEAEYDGLEKCPVCGDIMPENGETYGNIFTIEMDDEYPFCSEYCAEKDHFAREG